MLKILWSNLHQSYFIVAFAVGIIAGTILALVFRINYFSSPVWIAFVLLLFFVAFWKPKVAFLVIALIAGMFLAFFRVSDELISENYVRQFYDQEVMIEGVINGDPETDEGGTKIRVGGLKFGEGKREVGGTLYMMVRKNEELMRSDEVVLSGRLMSGFGTYVGYMFQPKIIKWRRSEPGDWILNVRNWFASRVRRLVPEPEVNLGLSYLLGMRTGLDDELNENLRTVGLVHIVVASGAHLSILVGIMRKIFGKISRFAGLLFSLVLIMVFMAMVGFTPSILRAGIMTILTLLAWYVGRKIAPWRLILLVAAGTLLISPNYVINLGWLLSFASFTGIMILVPEFKKIFYGKKEPRFVAGIVITTVAATLMTLPIVLYYYGQISLINLVANLLILPTLPYAMGLVFLAGVLADIPGIGIAVAWCATKLLDFHILVVDFFGQMQEFLVKIEPYQAWVFGIYGLIVLTCGLIVLNKYARKYGRIKA